MNSAEKAKALHTLAGLLAETLDAPVNVAELQRILECEDIDTWRSAVADVEIAHIYGSDAKGTGTGAPLQAWVCPSCGATQGVVDVRKALRRKADAASVFVQEGGPALCCENCSREPQSSCGEAASSLQ